MNIFLRPIRSSNSTTRNRNKQHSTIIKATFTRMFCSKFRVRVLPSRVEIMKEIRGMHFVRLFSSLTNYSLVNNKPGECSRSELSCPSVLFNVYNGTNNRGSDRCAAAVSVHHPRTLLFPPSLAHSLQLRNRHSQFTMIFHPRTSMRTRQ